jgi:hypothetical protein
MSLAEAAAIERRVNVEALVAMGVAGALEEVFDFPEGAGSHPPHAKPARPKEESVPE